MKAISETPKAVSDMIVAGLTDRKNFKIDTGNPENDHWINTRIQQLLDAGGYDNLENNQKGVALHTVLLDAIREKSIMIKEMLKNNEG